MRCLSRRSVALFLLKKKQILYYVSMFIHENSRRQCRTERTLRVTHHAVRIRPPCDDIAHVTTCVSCRGRSVRPAPAHVIATADREWISDAVLPTFSIDRSPPSGKPRYYPRPSCPLPRGATASSQQGGRQLIPRDRSKKGVTCRPATGARDVELEVGGISFSFSHPRRVRNLIGGAPTV